MRGVADRISCICYARHELPLTDTAYACSISLLHAVILPPSLHPSRTSATPEPRHLIGRNMMSAVRYMLLAEARQVDDSANGYVECAAGPTSKDNVEPTYLIFHKAHDWPSNRTSSMSLCYKNSVKVYNGKAVNRTEDIINDRKLSYHLGPHTNLLYQRMSLPSLPHSVCK